MAAGHGAYVPPTAPPFEASEARKTVHKINKQPRKDARCEKKQHLKCHGMKFLARAELSSVERAEQCEQSRAFAFVFQINFEMHK